tara:strand:+ start:282 stop:1475 length:1194 start_codon:yes stop_codon:yes gene_type:complete
MKIAIISDSKVNAGGSFHVTLSAFEFFRSVKFQDIECDFIVTQKLAYERLLKIKGGNLKFLNQNSFRFKLSSYLYRNSFIKIFYQKFLIKNYFESFINKNQYDLVFFITPSNLLLLCNKTKFIYTIWEFAHKQYPSMPEYDENTISNRDKLYNYACNNAFKIILFNEKSKEDFIKYYLLDSSKINTFFFAPHLSNAKEDNFLELEKKIKNKKYIFYPAQFWPHKNHSYLLESLFEYNKKNIEKIYLVFTGRNKGNRDFIKSKISNLKMNNEVLIFEYLSEAEICYLYENCFSVAFPSFVGSQSLPLFESFLFNKPIMYNDKIIDPIYKDASLQLNIDDKNSLKLNIDKILNDPIFILKMLDSGKKIYKESLETNVIKNKLSSLFEEYKKYKDLGVTK